MANWDDDDYDVPTTTASVPIIASKGKWEGEDEDDEDIPVQALQRPHELTACRMNGTQSQKTRSPKQPPLRLHQSPRRA